MSNGIRERQYLGVRLCSKGEGLVFVDYIYILDK